MKNRKPVQKSIRFSAELIELIEKIAKIENRKSTNLINKIVKDHFHKYNFSTNSYTIDHTNIYSNKEIIDLIRKWKTNDPKKI